MSSDFQGTKGDGIKALMGGVLLLFLGLAAMVQGCSDGPKTARVLQQAGYTEVVTSGYSMSCGREDGVCTAFKAKSPGGQSIRGAVGCGWLLKGCTIRIEP